MSTVEENEMKMMNVIIMYVMITDAIITGTTMVPLAHLFLMLSLFSSDARTMSLLDRAFSSF